MRWKIYRNQMMDDSMQLDDEDTDVALWTFFNPDEILTGDGIHVSRCPYNWILA